MGIVSPDMGSNIFYKSLFMKKIIFYDGKNYRIIRHDDFDFDKGKKCFFYVVEKLEKKKRFFTRREYTEWEPVCFEIVRFSGVIDIPREFDTLKKAKEYVKFLTSRDR